jgi:hypothetical protein
MNYGMGLPLSSIIVPDAIKNGLWLKYNIIPCYSNGIPEFLDI